MPNVKFPRSAEEAAMLKDIDSLSEAGATPAEVATIISRQGYRNRNGKRLDADAVGRLTGRTRPEGMVRELVNTTRSFESQLALSLEVLRVAGQKDERAAAAYAAFQGTLSNGGSVYDAIRAARVSLGMPEDWE